MDAALRLQDGAAADEADSGHQALDDAGLGLDAHVIRGSSEQHVATTGHGHHGKRAHTHAVRLAFPIPSHRQRQKVGDEQLDDVLQTLRPSDCEVHMWVIPPEGGGGKPGRLRHRLSFPRQNISGTLCNMQNSRDSSVWRTLAVAFGDGLAFGVGVTLTRTAARLAAARSATPELRPINTRTGEIEQRAGQARTAGMPPVAGAPLNHGATDAVLKAIDGRFTEI